MSKTNHGNPVRIKIICEWTKKIFYVDWKHRKQRFINKDAMYAWRKSQNRELVECLHCKKPFERYKHILHARTGKPTQYCSNVCSQSSFEVSEKRRKWGLSDKNHWKNKSCQDKVRLTKLVLYGDVYYNNKEQQRNTMMDRYGVPCSFYLPKCKSNGKRISKFQKKVYVDVLKSFPDAKLEVYLNDVQKFVDVFIPSENKVIECHGDYWHCNPSKFKSDYYNSACKMTAQELWDRDANKKRLLESAGYAVEVIWENTNKKFRHTTR